MSKNIFQIQQEIAKENKASDWRVLMQSLFGTMSNYDGMWLQLAERYAQSQTQEIKDQNAELELGNILLKDQIIHLQNDLSYRLALLNKKEEQNAELVEMLEKSLGALNDCCMVIDSEDEVFEYIKNLSMDITKVLFNYRTKINVK